jgi:6-pyruvoyltetrahydropterin/6-carboxytetrahydropterin synthase
MMQLTRRFAFSASHRLHSDQLGAEANACAFGMCQRVHGHNYRMDVTVAGDVDPKTGFFCNVLDLATLVRERITDPCEHQYLNDLPLFRGVIPTMENIAQVVWREIEAPLAAKGMRLVEVRVGETDEHWVRLRADRG